MPSNQIEANDKNLTQLNDLIIASENSLAELQRLKGLLIQYQEAQIAYLKNEDNVELLYKMISLAHSALTIVQERHLDQLFDAELLNELNLFANIARK